MLNKLLIVLILILVSFNSFSQVALNPFDHIKTSLSKTHQMVHSPSKTVNATGNFPIIIPDDDNVGISIPIDMTGAFSRNIANIHLALDIEHTWVGDLNATLVAPNGIAKLVVFSRVGLNLSDSDGSGGDLAGVYIFSDLAEYDLWVNSNEGVIPSGQYRTSTKGNSANDFGGCTTRLNGAFKGLTPEQSNGVWTLQISDSLLGDSGQVNGLSIQFSEEDIIFQASFERSITQTIGSVAPLQILPASNVLGHCKKAQYDFTGTGFSDYVTIFEDFNSNLVIQVISNDGSLNPIQTAFDYFLTELPISSTEMSSGGDFDGDGIKDFVFKLPLNDDFNQYLIRRSSRANDLPIQFLVFKLPEWVKVELQIGDYDGDGIDDLSFFGTFLNAVQRPQFSYMKSSTLEVGLFETSNGDIDDFRPAGGFDHNGDKVDDLALLINNNNGSQFYKVYDGTNGEVIFDTGSAVFNGSTRVVPGTFLHNGVAGLSTTNLIGNVRSWTIWDDTQNNNSLINVNSAGIGTADETPITGDYDGDGIDDFGYWDAANTKFVIRPSGSNDPNNNLIEVSPVNSSSSHLPLANIRIR